MPGIHREGVVGCVGSIVSQLAQVLRWGRVEKIKRAFVDGGRLGVGFLCGHRVYQMTQSHHKADVAQASKPAVAQVSKPAERTLGIAADESKWASDPRKAVSH